jgi:centromeric protein E
VLKVSALEIYNEVVKDLLTSDTNPLRLLDDKDVSSLSLILLLQTSLLKPCENMLMKLNI